MFKVERARRAMRVFFLVREISLAVRDEPDTHLPLTNPAACVQVADVLDLSKWAALFRNAFNCVL